MDDKSDGRPQSEYGEDEATQKVMQSASGQLPSDQGTAASENSATWENEAEDTTPRVHISYSPGLAERTASNSRRIYTPAALTAILRAFLLKPSHNLIPLDPALVATIIYFDMEKEK
ncbi:hypothetical protein AK830_g1046 [Neonectria ditissima]|uniref:Uncharacterized protein n=1 Tax=Neonectria ditissima TaxID=78410 RepID=A0A0P7BNS0_9HYPO|nr:hypothetical protein AK830_g1046 [Neonectria ditissima]